jgi:hypothetical protein
MNNRFVAVKDHLYSELKGEGVILSLKNGKYYGVNSVGACIWETVQNPVTFQEIQSNVMREFDVNEALCRQDVLSFLEKMTKEELVEVVDEKNF